MVAASINDAPLTKTRIKTAETSQSQQGLYFRCKLSPKNPAYNVSCSYRISGALDVAALDKSLSAIVNRHESLRTRFELVPDGLVQCIEPESVESERTTQGTTSTASSTSLQHLRTQSLPAGVNNVDRDQLLNKEINTPFDLDDGLLFRATLYLSKKSSKKSSQTSLQPTDEHLFVFVVHHLVFDHSSKSLLNFELSHFYNHFAHNSALELEPLQHQFSDYVSLKAEKLQGTTLEKQQSYWHKKLDSLEPPELPLDHPRPALPNSEGIRIERVLPEALVEQLKAISGKNQATLFMTTLAVANVLVSRLTGEDDISLGTHFADRRYPGADQMLGFLLNTLVLRSDVAKHSTFTDLLGDVQKTCFQAFRYSDLPFEKLVESLVVDRNYERNPFFDVRFTYLKSHEHPLQLEALSTQEIELSDCRARYDLTISVLERPDDHRVQVEYRKDLFDSSTIEWLLDKYIELLSTVCKNPEAPLEKLTLVDDKLRDKLLHEFNREAVAYPAAKTIAQLVSEQSVKTPNAAALRFNGQQLTYKELDDQSNQLARYLQSIGVGVETRVAVCFNRSLDMVLALLAVLKAGGTYLPIDRTYPSDRIEHMFNDSGTHFLLSDSAVAKHLPDCGAKRILLDNEQEPINSFSASPVDTAVSSDNTAYIIYTSGSTGMPKGVLVTHKNVVNFLHSMQKKPGLNAGDRLVAVTTLSFDIAVLEIWLPLVCGATSVIAASNVVGDGDKLKELIVSENATFMQATPVTWRLLIGAGWSGGRTFKALCGGEAMPADLAIDLHRVTGELWNMYGPTETTVWSACCQITDPQAPIGIGAAIDNTTLYILNSNKQLVPPGAKGELFIGGVGVSAGYHDRNALNHEKFIEDPFNPNGRLYATGDAARLRADGSVQFIARIDNQVKVRGLRIELGDIESHMQNHSDINLAVAVVREDTPGDQRIVGYFESNNSDQALVDELRHSLKLALPNYMVPQQLVRLDQIPLTPNGKLDRKSLPAVKADTAIASQHVAAPQTKFEIAMAAIWSEVLLVDSVPLDMTIFDMGGHSMLAMRVIAKARQDLKIDIDPMSMFNNTLREICAEHDPDSVSEGLQAPEKHVSDIKTFFFNPNEFGQNELYAVLHTPNKNTTLRGAVLLCNPIFMESNNIHWGYRRLATRLADAGYYVLRYDYYGCGNSQGEDEQGSIERWQQDTNIAANELKKLSGFDSISVVGFRYGATLASHLMSVPVDAFVLWEPVVSNKEHVDLLEEKYKAAIDEVNKFRTMHAVHRSYETIGYLLTDSMRETILNTSLQVDALLDNCNSVHLVSSQRSEDFNPLIESFQPASKIVGNLSKNLSDQTTKLNIKMIDEELPSVESLPDPSIWLPGKSIYQIVQLLQETTHA